MNDDDIEFMRRQVEGEKFVFYKHDIAIPPEGFGLNKWRTVLLRVVAVGVREDEPAAILEDGTHAALWPCERANFVIYDKEVPWPG